ncbi:hypothetical protein CVD28_01210 [Bacillus sp. M6-12]|nr:hypothetical protein CVD28_01210 [Bacillus sp. M6-12]
MFKLEMYLFIDNKWQNIGYSIRDRVPETDDKFYNKGKEYRVVDIKGEEYDIYFDVFLEFIS